jgi:hypothetical protein
MEESLYVLFQTQVYEIDNSVKIIFRKSNILNSEAGLSPELCELCIGSLYAPKAIMDLFNSVFTIALIIQSLTCKVHLWISYSSQNKHLFLLEFQRYF